MLTPQEKAVKKYREKNREKTRLDNYRRNARLFIRQCDDLEDLKEIKEMLDDKIKEITGGTKMEKTDYTGIYKNKEDGSLTLGYREMDMDDFDPLTLGEFIDEVESADRWDFVGPDVYEDVFDRFEFDYNSYDGPEEMWEDFLKLVEG